MKKNMLTAILFATFFSCTELLDEVSITEEGKQIIADSLNNIGQKDSINIEDSLGIGDEIEDTSSVDDQEPEVFKTGLFSTNKELEIWRERMQYGPFKTLKDLAINSPGDFERIVKNATYFLQNPSRDRVSWPNSPLVHGSFEPRRSHIGLRDAAFLYSLTEDLKYANAVKKELLAQSAESSCDFNNTTIFRDVTSGNPFFDISSWMSRMLYAYDLVETTFSDAEKTQMKAWFLKGARMYQKFIDSHYENLWPNRKSGNYAPTDRAQKFSTYTHHNGYKVYLANRWYNNRAASEVMYYGLVGIKFNDATLINSAKRWFKEWIKFAIYPSGLCVEFHRTVDAPHRTEAGYDYSSATTDYMTNLADALARAGDTELYDFTTSEGYGESKGGNKSLLLVMQTLSNLLYDQYYDPKTKSHAIYSGSTHNFSSKMDGRREDNVFATPIWFAHANLYYDDSTIKSTYNKIVNENLTYNNVAGLDPFGGAWNIFPGKLFMWGNLEGKVNPYIISF